MNFLSGYKTYIICGIAIAYAVAQYWQGSLDLNGTLQMVMAALGGATMRAGIAKA